MFFEFFVLFDMLNSIRLYGVVFEGNSEMCDGMKGVMPNSLFCSKDGKRKEVFI